jgi:integrase
LAVEAFLIGNGLDPVTVAGVLGHGDPNITLKVYAHLFNRQEREEAIRRALGSRSG